MSTHIQSESSMTQLSEAAREVAGEVENLAGEFTHATKDAAKCATDTVKNMYHKVAGKAGDTLATSKDYVRRNPVPAVLGAVAIGVAFGYMLVMARRKPSFGERDADEPLGAVRDPRCFRAGGARSPQGI